MEHNTVTIKDIAKALSLSKSTVSRALRDRYDINPETKAAVLSMAASMRYRPNKIAQSLKQKKTSTIGVIIPSYMLPFYSYAISGIYSRASLSGYNVITCQSNEKSIDEKKSIETLIDSRVDGIILSLAKESTTFQHIEDLITDKIPLVLFNRAANGLNVSKVTVDDYYGARAVVEHLISIGRKRIAHLCGPLNLFMSRNRKKGYIDALANAGILVNNEYLAEGDFTIQSGERACGLLLDKDPLPDAIFCVCDEMAFGAMKEIRRRGLSIPSDIAIAGFTNEPVAALVNPPLTTIAQPAFEIGENAAAILIDHIENPTKPIQQLELKTKLIIRESTVG